MADRLRLLLNSRIRKALSRLLEAYYYARDTNRDVWTYAIDFGSLCDDGLLTNDLRWLVCAGYVKHAQETTEDGDNQRKFRPVSNVRFASETCFVLTEAGVSLSEELPDEQAQLGAFVQPTPVSSNDGSDDTATSRRAVPKWNSVRRELRIGNRLVKQFRLPSPNQETVLAAFEEENWPEVIDDPLPHQPNLDPKRRLQDTLKGLNRHQVNQLIRFKGDGTGEGVLWEWADGLSRNGAE